MPEGKSTEEMLREIAEGNLETLEFLVAVNAASMEASGLDPETLMMVRIAALAAIDAPSVSWRANLEVAAEADLSIEQVRGVLTAVAPLVGTAKFISAVGKVRQALGLA
jgi:alkylhydroperoxidase/carboxymuconolactone decarboxylase family protein YurZ